MKSRPRKSPRDAPWIGPGTRPEHRWITSRDRNYDFQSRLMCGGTAVGTDYVSCKARMTKERLDELEKEWMFWGSKGYLRIPYPPPKTSAR